MLRYPKLLALAAGALSATGFAPLELWPVTILCLVLLIRLLGDAPTWRSAFWRMWLFALGHFTVGLNWIAHAFTYQDSMPHWFGYGAVVALSLYLAVFPAVGAAVAHALTRSSRAQSRGASPESEQRPSTSLGTSGLVFPLLLAAAWIATEWLRATLFTGFAWNPLAAIWVPVLPVAQATKWVGTYGLSGLTVLAAGGALLVARRRWAGAALIVPLPLLALLLLPHPAAPGPLAVRIVQPNVSQDEKQDVDAQAAHLQQLVRMSGPPGASPRLLLWPEAAIDNGYLLAEEPGLRRYLARALGPGDVLLTGGIALEYDQQGRAIGGRNSVFALAPDTRILARYDKAHLVPYGEYLPMRAILTPLGLSRLVPGDLDFWPGPGPKTFDIPGVGPIGFQICYEIIFSGQVIDPAHRPLFLFNPSNDAWFGSWGPPQHLAQARLRAIEEGMTIVRATPTGISAVIAPNGRIEGSIGLGKQGVLDAHLPAPLPPTPFARYGNLLPALLALALVALGVVIRIRRR
ncbi:apolipoprotein N-acyltransferase [Sphingomonas changbaiensis NBRC 104936]|uniref:Apolipoprotein N-acyltransferase n=1 Tax=Sphingomonas changbaiensis NBRC 104936 TaxID=1219043 RepID=A0A0E9MRF3_9SPHN|nr:apolipoprotein N-acyltransferase [Sphingomonas changbaiensis]GAO39720.1 apolipoprotein N-acyltransferase [Sphingomonas changbaiensis NBRC 104936]